MASYVFLQMNALESLTIKNDSSMALAFEAQKRGYSLFCYEPGDLSLAHNADDSRVDITARGYDFRLIQGSDGRLALFEVMKESVRSLREARVLFMRQDPPFDISYITATYMLSFVAKDVLIVNNPEAVRNAPEKITPLLFPDFIPPTIITRDIDTVKAFYQQHGAVVIKPLYASAGFGIFRLLEDDVNLTALVEFYRKISPEPIVVQKYLAQVSEGDKRVLIVNGDVVGAYIRIPHKQEMRANAPHGSRSAITELTKKETMITNHVGAFLKKSNILFAGIDFIGEYLTEINVTSPTGIPVYAELTGIDIAPLVWDHIEERLSHDNRT